LQDNSEFQILDVRDALMEAKENTQVYYATDTHWNPTGAYVAYHAIIDELNKSFPDLEAIPLEQFSYQPTPLRIGDMARHFVHVDIPEEYYNYKPGWDSKVEFRAFPSIDHYEYQIPGSDAYRLLVFHDSFGFGMMPFITQHFSYSSFYGGYDIDPFTIESEKPDIVLILWTERSLAKLLEIPDL